MLLLSGEGSGFDSQFLHLSLIERVDLLILMAKDIFALSAKSWCTEGVGKCSCGPETGDQGTVMQEDPVCPLYCSYLPSDQPLALPDGWCFFDLVFALAT